MSNKWITALTCIIQALQVVLKDISTCFSLRCKYSEFVVHLVKSTWLMT
jgi:hypothetical protein